MSASWSLLLAVIQPFSFSAFDNARLSFDSVTGFCPFLWLFWIGAPFTNDQAAYLREAYPRGAFASKSTYQWCDGRIWVYFDSRGDTWNFGQQCWRVDR